MEERTEAQKVLQLPLTVVVGGMAKKVRPRTMAESDAWVEKSLVAQIVRKWGAIGKIESWEDAVNQLSGAGDAVLTCIVEYDADAELGDRDWLYNHATPAELWEALKILAKSAFPFVPDAVRMVPTLVSMVMAEIAKQAKPSEQAPSTPGPSGTGDVSPRKSTAP